MDLSLEPVAMNSEEDVAGGGFLRPAMAVKLAYEAGGAKTAHSTTCS